MVLAYKNFLKIQLKIDLYLPHSLKPPDNQMFSGMFRCYKWDHWSRKSKLGSNIWALD